MLARINRRFVPAYWDDYFNNEFYNNLMPESNRSTRPAVNVVEDEHEYRIELAVPGISRKEIKIDLEEDVLTVSSEQKESKDDKKHNFVRREFGCYSFSRRFQLPDTVDQEKIRASHDSGVLTVMLPKKDEVVQKAPKQIEIS